MAGMVLRVVVKREGPPLRAAHFLAESLYGHFAVLGAKYFWLAVTFAKEGIHFLHARKFATTRTCLRFSFIASLEGARRIATVSISAQPTTPRGAPHAA